MIDATQTTLYPGGILNTGFAVDWAKERDPRRQAGVGQRRAALGLQADPGGRPTCKANQALHGEAVDLLAEDPRQRPLRAAGRRPARRRSRSSTRSRCRCFMACQWTDEQTGGHCPTLAEHLTGTQRSGSRSRTAPTSTRSTRRPSTAGTTSSSSTSPSRRRSPTRRRSRPRAPVIYQEAMGITGRDAAARPDPAAADLLRRRWRRSSSSPPIRVLFDNGAGGSTARPAVPRLRAVVRPSFPIPGTTARSWYLGAERRARRQAARARPARTRSRWDAHARPLTDFTGDTGAGAGGLWTATPPYQWRRTRPGSAASYVTQPAERRTRPSSAPAPCTPGSAPRRRTSTCRRRSARSGPTARRRSCRAAGCAPTSASSTRARARRSSPS